MRRHAFAFAAFPGLLVALAIGCSNQATGGDGAAAGGDTGDDEGMGPTPGPSDDEAGPAADAAGPAPPTSVRVAHVSPDLPPMDVCLALRGTTNWRGPLIGQLAGVEAGAPGLAYAQVSAYVPVGPGQYDVRVVPAGSSCSPRQFDLPADAEPADAEPADAEPADAGPAPDGGLFPTLPVITSLPALPATGYATLVVAGEVLPATGDHGLTFSLVADDSRLAGGAASLRAVNALPRLDAMNLDLGAFGAKWTTLLANVAFGAASAQAGASNGTVDRNGYLPIPPLSGVTFSVASPWATADAVTASSVTISFGSIATVVAIGGAVDDAAHPAALLLCIDNEPSGGALSDCRIAR